MNQVQRIPHSFRKSTKNLATTVLAVGLGLFVGATHSLAATNLTWKSSSGVFSTASNWDPAQSPATDDSTLFTNDTSHTVSFTGNTPVMDSNTFSNHAGVVTLDLGANTWTVTNNFYVGKADATSTVYLASGTLNVGAVAFPASAQLRIGDATTNLFSCMGALHVTNGTVVVNSAVVGPTNDSRGKLVITGSGVLQPDSFGNPSTLTIGVGSDGNQLFVTNGGRLFVDGTLSVGSSSWASNNSAVFSGPTSAATLTTAGYLRLNGNGSSLIVSNGAKITATGSMLFGSSCSYSTSIVVGAGSALIAAGSVQIGLGATGGTNNCLTVYDGGFISCAGTFAFGNNSFHVNDGLNFGGKGSMSTGLFTVIRSSSVITNHEDNFITISNAFVSCNYFNPQGPQEIIAILANGTLKLTNSISIPVPFGNSNSVNMGGAAGSPGGSILLINGGTLDNLLTADNVGGISLGGNGHISLIVTNGGKLLTSMGTIGAGTSGNTGIVTGVGSVWSNFSGVAGFTNVLFVGTNAGGSNDNFFGVSDGGSFFTPGDLLIGNNAGARNNAAALGGRGAVSRVTILGDLQVGSGGGTSSNKLTITNAAVSCGSIIVGQPTLVVSNYTFTTNDIVGGLVVTNFCTTTNNLVATVLTNCTPTVTTNSAFNVVTISSGTITGLSVQVVVSNTLVYSGGTLFFTNLQVNGIMTGTATVNVPNGSTLQGVGSIANPVTVANGGILAPGTSVGTLTISNNLVLNSTSVLRYELGSTGSADKTVVVGNLTLDGVLNVTTNNTDGLFGVGNYTLITYTGTLTDNVLGIGTMPPGLSYAIVAGGGSVVLQVTAGGGGDPFTAWQTFYFPDGGPNAAPGADSDGDGVSNTNEFLSGFSPTNNAAYAHIISVARTSGTNVTLTYLGANGDSTWSPGIASRTNVLESTTGTAGSYSNNFVSTGITNILSSGTGLGTVATMIHTNGATATPARYYRIRVLVP